FGSLHSKLETTRRIDLPLRCTPVEQTAIGARSALSQPLAFLARIFADFENQDRKAISGLRGRLSALVIVCDASISAQNRGASVSRRIFRKNERWGCN